MRCARQPHTSRARRMRTAAPTTARPAITPGLRLLPPPPVPALPSKRLVRVLMVLGWTHSPCRHPLRESPLVPKRVWRTDCLNAHEAPEASQVTEIAPDRPLMVSTKSMLPPPPQKTSPMQRHLRAAGQGRVGTRSAPCIRREALPPTHSRFWQDQSTVVPVVEVVLL